MRPLFLLPFLVLSACSGTSGSDGDGDGDTDGDSDCDSGPGIELDCPEDVVDLGCIPQEGVALELDINVAACEGDPTISCEPPLGELVSPGDTTVRCTAQLADEEVSCDIEVHAGREGSFDLHCPEGVESECTGALTPVEVPQAEVDEQCGSFVGSLTNNAPEDGYPLGTTNVIFSGTGDSGYSTSCETVVTVMDRTAPNLECPAAFELTRTAPGEAVLPPSLLAADLCDGDLEAHPTPSSLSGGTTIVTYASTDSSGNTSYCEVDITVVEAYAVNGLRLAHAELEADASTTIALAWDPSYGADTTGYRIERAPAVTGPWTAVTTVGPDTLVYEDETLPESVNYYRVITLAGDIEGGIANPIRVLAIAADDYDIRGQSVPEVHFSTTLYGVVRYPVATDEGPFPLVLFLHGNHGNCRPDAFTSDDICAETEDHECHLPGYSTTPNAEGLAYLAETLAAQGYVAVSISGNALNCRADFIIERAELILEHIRRWSRWSLTGGAPFGDLFVGVINMESVGLVGHSRGGEAVAVVPARFAATPVAGVNIDSIFSIAPTDNHEPQPEGVAYAVLLPACDGDVYTLEGMNIYDRSLDVTEEVIREQFFFTGANHNFFNTEWRYDDNGMGLFCPLRAEVGDIVQQRALETMLSAWFKGTIDEGELESFLEAEAPIPEGIDAWTRYDLDLRLSHATPVRSLIDDFSGGAAPETNLLGESNSFVSYNASRDCFQSACDSSFPHRLNGLLLSWDEGVPTTTIGLGNMDASSARALSFRMTSRWSHLNNDIEEQEFLVRVRDTSGAEVEFPLTSLQIVPHLYNTNAIREILQTVRLPIAEIRTHAAEFDLTALAALELEMTMAGHGQGSIIITNIELAQ